MAFGIVSGKLDLHTIWPGVHLSIEILDYGLQMWMLFTSLMNLILREAFCQSAFTGCSLLARLYSPLLCNIIT